MPELNDIFVPQFSLAVSTMSDDTEMMMLVIETASVQVNVALATASNYKQVADKLAEGIRRVGSEMKKPSRIIPAKGVPDGAIRTPQRRK